MLYTDLRKISRRLIITIEPWSDFQLSGPMKNGKVDISTVFSQLTSHLKILLHLQYLTSNWHPGFSSNLWNYSAPEPRPLQRAPHPPRPPKPRPLLFFFLSHKFMSATVGHWGDMWPHPLHLKHCCSSDLLGHSGEMCPTSPQLKHVFPGFGFEDTAFTARD